MKIKKADQQIFEQVVSLIREARQRAFSSVNEELIKLYWNVGEIISEKVEAAEWGDSVVDQLADFIDKESPDIKGFNRRGLYRMKQFYEAWNNADEKVSTLLTQISWSNHLAILSKCKSEEERQFYLQLAAKEKYSFRELSRQIDSGNFERTMLSGKNVSTALTQIKQEQEQVFKDNYVLDFLNLPDTHDEKDLQKAIVRNLREFILEFGKDFCFIGNEHRLQVGDQDFYIDLLFFHRELQCLVAIELKITDFKPEYVGKMNFYLEALDRETKKLHENPSVGIILCKSKNEEIVEYALSRSLTPAKVSEYQTRLPDKKLLQAKLHELSELWEDKEKDEEKKAKKA